MIATTVLGLVLTLWPNFRWLGVASICLAVLYFTLTLGRWWEYGRLTSSPHIDFQIHESYIVPTTNTASCFLRVSLHNEIGPPVGNLRPTLTR